MNFSPILTTAPTTFHPSNRPALLCLQMPYAPVLAPYKSHTGWKNSVKLLILFLFGINSFPIKVGGFTFLRAMDFFYLSHSSVPQRIFGKVGKDRVIFPHTFNYIFPKLFIGIFSSIHY